MSIQTMGWDKLMGGKNISRKMAMLRAKAIVRSLQAIGLDQALKNCDLRDLEKSHADGDWD